jgi:hypothetical protein
VRGAHSKFRSSKIHVVALAFVLLSLNSFCAYSDEAKHELLSGITAIRFLPEPQKEFSFSARLSLPKVPSNKSWYAVWLEVGRRTKVPIEDRAVDIPVMIQTGLLRDPESGFRLWSFVGTQPEGKGVATHFWPIDLGEEHQFTISGTAKLLTIVMDGAEIFSCPRSEVFKDSMELFASVDAEVFADGDSASGTARQLWQLTASGKIILSSPFWIIEDRGLRFQCSADALSAGGTFDPKQKTYWRKLGCAS